MATQEEKLNKFIQAINRDAQERRAAILAQTEAFNKAELEKAELEALTEAYHLIQQEISEMRSRVYKGLSRRELALYREALTRRCAIADRVIEDAKQKIRAFTESGEYIGLLKDFAREAAAVSGDGPVELCLREKDMPFSSELVSFFAGPCKVEQDDGIDLGGLKVRCPAKNIVIDETLDSRLMSQRQWFTEHAELRVQRVGA